MINDITNININDTEIFIYTGMVYTKIVLTNKNLTQIAFERINNIMNGQLFT